MHNQRLAVGGCLAHQRQQCRQALHHARDVGFRQALLQPHHQEHSSGCIYVQHLRRHLPHLPAVIRCDPTLLVGNAACATCVGVTFPSADKIRFRVQTKHRWISRGMRDTHPPPLQTPEQSRVVPYRNRIYKTVQVGQVSGVELGFRKTMLALWMVLTQHPMWRIITVPIEYKQSHTDFQTRNLPGINSPLSQLSHLVWVQRHAFVSWTSRSSSSLCSLAVNCDAR